MEGQITPPEISKPYLDKFINHVSGIHPVTYNTSKVLVIQRLQGLLLALFLLNTTVLATVDSEMASKHKARITLVCSALNG